MFVNDSMYVCPTCRQGLRPLKTDPSLGFLCYGCPAIVTVFPSGECHIREVWSGREFYCGLDTLRMEAVPRREEMTRPA